MKYIVILITLCTVCSCTLTHPLARKSSYAGASFAQKKVSPKPEVETPVAPIKVVDASGDTVSILSKNDFTQDEKGEQIRTVTANTVSVIAKSRMIPERMGKVNLDFIVSMPKDMQNRCYAVMITPTLHRNDNKQTLEELSIRGLLLSNVQERDHWQFEKHDKFLRLMSVYDTARAERMKNDFIRYPYPSGVRLDSIVNTKEAIAYHYTQEVPVTEGSKKMLITVDGRVVALDRSNYKLPSIDTLIYNISSMLAFVDTTSRYVTKIIDKYATVQDRNYLNFKINNTQIIDTLGSNAEQLGKIKTMMQTIITQDEFIIDSIILTASASPEGFYSQNAKLSTARAKSLSEYLYHEIDPGIDTLLSIRSNPEDWVELRRLILGDSIIKNRDAIVSLIDVAKDYDATEKQINRQYPDDYRYIRKTYYPQLRSVTFRYALRRRGMEKDTVHTTELDTVYAKGIAFLKARNYAKALYHLHDYKDQNTAVSLLSMGYDNEAYTLLSALKPTAINRYLLAIVCSRIEKYREGKLYYEESCALDENMEFRGGLDPEITELLRH